MSILTLLLKIYEEPHVHLIIIMNYDSLVIFYFVETFFAGFHVLMHAQCV